MRRPRVHGSDAKACGEFGLQGGVPYWLVASAGGAGTDAVWNASNILDGGVKINQGGGLWMASVDSFGGSFDVVGSVSDSGSGGSPVPEPPGALLLAVGFCALCAIKVRRTIFQPRLN